MAQNNEYKDTSVNDPAVLREMNRRLIAGLREADQEKYELQAKIDKDKASRKKLDKMTSDLCKLIMTKTRGSNDEKPDFSLSLEQKIEIATTEVKTYFASLRADIDNTKLAAEKMLKRSESRTKKLEEQTQEIKELRAKLDGEQEKVNEAFNELIDMIGRRTELGVIKPEDYDMMVAAFLKKAQKKYGLKVVLDKRTTKIGIQADDGIGDAVASTIGGMDTIAKDIKPKVIPDADLGPDVILPPEDENNIQDAIERISEEHAEAIIEAIKRLPPSQRLVIRAIGESGKAETPEIRQWMKEHTNSPVSESTINTALRELTIKSQGDDFCILEGLIVTIPESPKVKLYRFTSEGEYVFKQLFQKDPLESEWTALVKEHGSPAHGYGIKRTARLLRQTAWVKGSEGKVVYYTRANYMIKTDGVENSWFIPDIVVERIDHQKNIKYITYIEYETGDCTPHDMKVKLTKIARKTSRVIFVVPNEKAAQVTEEKVMAWKAGIPEQKDFIIKGSQFRVLLITFAGLKTSMSAKTPNFKQIAEVRAKS